ncbi:MAG: rhamnulokinase family protein [Oscillospiraceae bacterium]
MNNITTALAFDFGASSGRAILGKFDGEKIELFEIHRFENTPVKLNSTMYWDFLRLFHEVKLGLIKASSTCEIDSIGVDTWGVDFGLINHKDMLLENPIHYRDSRTVGLIQEVDKVIPINDIYEASGNQTMELNTIFQLYSLLKNRPELLLQTDKFLLIPDLFNYFLTGKKYAEHTIASTTQLFNSRKKEWDKNMIEKLGLSMDFFPELISAGTVVGELTNELCEELAISTKPVIAVASHDTASAVVAAPATEEDFIFISCGTWSLFGTELQQPIINEISNKLNIANESGFDGTTTFLKNIIGLWLIQETRRQFIRDGKNYTYADMERLAKECEPFKCFIDPNADEFVPSGNIPKRIREFCQRTGQYPPQTDGEIIRCIYESIAMEYRNAYNQITSCTQKCYHKIHMLGGGTKDSFLCQLTANATKCEVIAGPIEATALGNIAVQLIALGKVKDIAQARTIISNSFSPIQYQPIDVDIWNSHFKTYEKLLINHI